MLGVDHCEIILLSTPFPTIPMLGTNCWCNVIVFYVGNKRCCVVLYCIVLHFTALHCSALYIACLDLTCHFYDNHTQDYLKEYLKMSSSK